MLLPYGIVLYELSPIPRPRVGLVVDFPQPPPGDVGVDLGGAQAGVPEQFLDGPQISACLQEMSGEGVAQGVRADVVLGAGVQDMAMHYAAHAAVSQRPAARVEEEWVSIRRVGGRGHARPTSAGQMRPALRQVVLNRLLSLAP